MSFRWERKYPVRNELLPELRRRLRPFLQMDAMAGRGSNGEYTVRSIYFDTPAFDSLGEKIEGLRDKRKLRVRGYNAYRHGCDVYLEVKQKYGDQVAKYRAATRYDLLAHTLTTGELEPSEGQVPPAARHAAQMFFYHLNRHLRQPVSLIVYEREAFFGKFDPRLRITVDKNLRASLFREVSELFSDQALSHVWDDSFLLEVKYSSAAMPSWVRNVIQEFGLTRDSVSKYALAFQSGRP